MSVMTDPVHRPYFYWLYDRACEVRDPESPHSYITVCSIMQDTMFKVVVRRDDNRAADAIELRRNFLRENGYEGPDDILHPDATVFEVLVALAGRADFMIDWPVRDCFAQFLVNLRLAGYTDEYCEGRSTWRIRKVIDRFNDRTYNYDGKGGLFPLRHPEEDQREVELWYQMGAYMTENHLY